MSLIVVSLIGFVGLAGLVGLGGAGFGVTVDWVAPESVRDGLMG